MPVAGRINRIEDGTVTNAKLAGGIVSSKLDTPGQVLQVQNSIKTDTIASAGAAAWQDIGLSVNITPTSTSSKIYVLASVSGSLNNSNTWLALLRGTTFLGLGDAASNRLQCTFGNFYTFGDANIMRTHGFQLLDSPSSTSALTYKVQVRSAANTWYVNRTEADADDVDRGRASSSITVMEIAS